MTHSAVMSGSGLNCQALQRRALNLPWVRAFDVSEWGQVARTHHDTQTPPKR